MTLVLGTTGATAQGGGARLVAGSQVGLTLVDNSGGAPFEIGFYLPTHLTISAVEMPNGEVNGQGMAHFLGGSPDFTFEVTCVSFQDNQAWIGAEITTSKFPFPPEFGFWYEDNGEGAGGPPDRISSASFVMGLPGGQQWCDLQPTQIDRWEIVHGNIHVKS
jgi:hypothetical protein